MIGGSAASVRNFGFLLASHVVAWGLAFVLAILLPRFLGVTDVSKLYLANSIWIAAMLMAVRGTDLYLVKEVSRCPSSASDLFWPALTLRAALGVLAWCLVALGVHLAGYAAETVTVIYVIGAGYLIMQLGEVPRALLGGLERMDHVALGTIASKLFITLVTVALLLAGYGLPQVVLVPIGGALIYLVVPLTHLQRVQRLRWRGSLADSLLILRGSLPYLFSDLFLVLYVQMDIVILSLLADEVTVGWYGAAARLSGSLVFLPVLMVTALYPTLARMASESPEQLAQVTARSSYLLLLIGMPLGLGLAAVARPLAVALFGLEFAGSGPVLALLGFVLILTYQNILLARVLVSIDRQRSVTAIIAIAMLATVLLDIVLVPWCARVLGNGAIGGALAFVGTEWFVLLSFVFSLPLTIRRGLIDRRWLRMSAASVAVFGLATWLRDYPVWVPVLAGALLFGFLAPVLRLVTLAEIRAGRELIRAAREGLSSGSQGPRDMAIPVESVAP